MSDNDSSGNRWEPDTTPPGADDPGRDTTAFASPPAAGTADAPGPDDAEPGAPGRPGLRDRVRGLRGSRAAIVTGAAAAMVVVAGAGFAAGWAASPDEGGQGGPGRDGHHGFPGDFGDRDGDGHGPFSPGEQPDGSLPSPPTSPEDGSGTESSWYVVPAPSGTSA